jgi:hypothetical protein
LLEGGISIGCNDYGEGVAFSTTMKWSGNLTRYLDIADRSGSTRRNVICFPSDTLAVVHLRDARYCTVSTPCFLFFDWKHIHRVFRELRRGTHCMLTGIPSRWAGRTCRTQCLAEELQVRTLVTAGVRDSGSLRMDNHQAVRVTTTLYRQSLRNASELYTTL